MRAVITVAYAAVLAVGGYLFVSAFWLASKRAFRDISNRLANSCRPEWWRRLCEGVCRWATGHTKRQTDWYDWIPSGDGTRRLIEQQTCKVCGRVAIVDVDAVIRELMLG